MKNALLMAGFIICMLATYGAMQFGKSMMKDFGEWAPNSEHVKKVEAASLAMIDKCKLDRLQGRLAGYAESIECSSATIREAFAKEGFPHMERIDAFLKQRVELGKKADNKEITEEEMSNLSKQALIEALEKPKAQ